jgi:hypothetical protein
VLAALVARSAPTTLRVFALSTWNTDLVLVMAALVRRLPWIPSRALQDLRAGGSVVADSEQLGGKVEAVSSRLQHLAVASAALCAGVLVLSPPAKSAADISPYDGLGTWVSIYDRAAWRNPEQTVQAIADRGVVTLFLETSNYRQRADVVRPALVGRFLEAAHALGISVVGWYLPSFAQPPLDVRRALAGITYRSPTGERFDSFALDIESTAVGSFALRNARTLQVVTRLRRALPLDYALGAITIAPVGASPGYWPNFPFLGLSRLVDVFLPMAYFTERTRGPSGVRAYTTANLRFIRAQVGDPTFPVHPIGGLAERATASEVEAFIAAAASCGTLGASLWEYSLTTRSEWSQLAAAPPRTTSGNC